MRRCGVGRKRRQRPRPQPRLRPPQPGSGSTPSRHCAPKTGSRLSPPPPLAAIACVWTSRSPLGAHRSTIRVPTHCAAPGQHAHLHGLGMSTCSTGVGSGRSGDSRGGEGGARLGGDHTASRCHRCCLRQHASKRLHSRRLRAPANAPPPRLHAAPWLFVWVAHAWDRRVDGAVT
jgi:hypothetical protein